MFADDPFHPEIRKNKVITVEIIETKEIVKEKLRLDRKTLLEITGCFIYESTRV